MKNNMQKIPFFNYPALFAQREEEYLEVVNNVLRKGAYIMQEELFDFEDKLASYLGVNHAIGVADGTMALLMSLMAAGVGEGDEVIVPSHTFVASAAAIHHTGAKPVLVECARDHLIDHNSVQSAITEKTKAIMPVQLNGRVANMEPILAIAKKNGLLIIEDSCQALGAKFDNVYAGTFGVAGTFSFFPAKTLGCFGDGGGIITNDSDIADKITMIRDHGRSPIDGKVKLFGFNGRLDNLHAAILGLKLKYYDEDIARRRSIAQIYQECLGELDTLLLPPGPNSDLRHYDVFQNYEIEALNRDELRVFLEKNGVGTILQWGGYGLHQFPDLDLNTDLPFTEAMTKKFMLLPMHPMLKDEDVLFICDLIKQFYDKTC